MFEPMLKGGTSVLDAQSIVTKLDIHEGWTVADLGCGGSGLFVAPLARAVGKTGRVFALDIQKNVLQVVESNMKFQNIENVTTVWSDLEKVGKADISNTSCDFALLINVLFQNTDHEAILQESARILKAGAPFGVIDWKMVATPFGPPLTRRVSQDTVMTLAAASGFQFASSFEAGPYHYALVFKKL